MRLSDVLELVSTGSTAVIAIATAAGVVTAIYQLNAWRVQARGTAEYRLARDVLKAVYDVRECFKHVRSPAIYAFEYPQHLLGSNQTIHEKDRARATTHVYDKRLEVLADAFRRLEDLNLDAEVHWGEPFKGSMVEFRILRFGLRQAISDHIQDMDDRPFHRKREPTEEQIAERNSALYYLGEEYSEQDQFTPRINEAVARFEGKLLSIIRSRKS